MIEFLREAFALRRSDDAIVRHDRTYSYGDLLDRTTSLQRRFDAWSLAPGTVVALEADFSLDAAAALLALIERGCILVPRTPSGSPAAEECGRMRLAQVEAVLRCDGSTLDGSTPDGTFRRTDVSADHALYRRLRDERRSGLVLFSSGSSGVPKVAVHDFGRLLDKFRTPRRAGRMIAFLKFDHIGGLNTLLHAAAYGGCLIAARDRSPDGVLDAVARHRAEVLPASPTFLNLILLSDAHRRHDLSSLRLITYGTEPMPESTLRRFCEILPNVEFRQTYGLSELGILRAKSKASDSTWVRVGGEGIGVRIVDGLLQIQTPSAMLGYLNAPAPFTDDGWFMTGDAVEQDGEYLRILGRASEMINVGGEKVHPAEVEDAILALDNIAGAIVHGEPNPIVGAVVRAQVALREPEERRAAIRRIQQGCRERLALYKVPVRIELVPRIETTERMKTQRPRSTPASS